MTGPQQTVVIVLVGLSTVLTGAFYPAVRKEASSAAYSLLATWIASALFAIAVALVAGAIHNALVTL
ncbi:MAG: hypothetical protein H6729_10905 [Deltaproteobacteria bacterium]|nr:hypothetical protein [Deltaproteobacteria bacterium]